VVRSFLEHKRGSFDGESSREGCENGRRLVGDGRGVQEVRRIGGGFLQGGKGCRIPFFFIIAVKYLKREANQYQAVGLEAFRQLGDVVRSYLCKFPKVGASG